MERTQDLDVTTDELWEAISDPEQLAGWLGDEVDLEVAEGATGRVVDDGEVRRVVVDAVEPARVAFTWWPEARPDEVSQVELVVLPLEQGSRLIVRESLAPSARWGLRMTLLGIRMCAGARV